MLFIVFFFSVPDRPIIHITSLCWKFYAFFWSALRVVTSKYNFVQQLSPLSFTILFLTSSYYFFWPQSKIIASGILLSKNNCTSLRGLQSTSDFFDPLLNQSMFHGSTRPLLNDSGTHAGLKLFINLFTKKLGAGTLVTTIFQWKRCSMPIHSLAKSQSTMIQTVLSRYETRFGQLDLAVCTQNVSGRGGVKWK